MEQATKRLQHYQSESNSSTISITMATSSWYGKVYDAPSVLLPHNATVLQDADLSDAKSMKSKLQGSTITVLVWKCQS